jgi:hypothetical protein
MAFTRVQAIFGEDLIVGKEKSVGRETRRWRELFSQYGLGSHDYLVYNLDI